MEKCNNNKKKGTFSGCNKKKQKTKTNKRHSFQKIKTQISLSLQPKSSSENSIKETKVIQISIFKITRRFSFNFHYIKYILHIYLVLCPILYRLLQQTQRVSLKHVVMETQMVPAFSKQ